MSRIAVSIMDRSSLAGLEASFFIRYDLKRFRYCRPFIYIPPTPPDLLQYLNPPAPKASWQHYLVATLSGLTLDSFLSAFAVETLLPKLLPMKNKDCPYVSMSLSIAMVAGICDSEPAFQQINLRHASDVLMENVLH